jgi:DNA-binding NarL/FixJ family response regulator
MGHQAVFLAVSEVTDPGTEAADESSWGNPEHAATELPVGLWPSMAASPALTAAVGAPSPAGERRLAEVLQRDGVNVEVTFPGFSGAAFDQLPAHLDAVVLATGGDEAEVEQGLRRVRGALHPAAIVIVCPRSAERHLLRFLEWGADGVVFADDLDVVLATAVRGAVAGQISVPKDMRHLLAPPALTHREKQVLELAARGLTNSQIASSLYLAESTVKTHLSAAFRRLGVNSRREATALICATDSTTRRLLLPTAPRLAPNGAIAGQIEDCQPLGRDEHEHVQHA